MFELKMPQIPPIPAIVPDEELVLKAQEGDRDALGELFRRHANHVANIARQMAPRDYEDIVQDAYVKATESIAQCRGAFGGWFSMIVRNQAINRYREARKLIARTDSLDARPIEVEDKASREQYEVPESSADVANRLANALASLTPAQKQVVAALYAEAESSESPNALLKRVAARMGKTEGAIRNAMFQIRRSLQERTAAGELRQIVARRDRDDILSIVIRRLLPDLKDDQARRAITETAALAGGSHRANLVAVRSDEADLWEMGLLIENDSETPAFVVAESDLGRKSRAELLEWAAAVEARIRRVCGRMGIDLSIPCQMQELRIVQSRGELLRLQS